MFQGIKYGLNETVAKAPTQGMGQTGPALAGARSLSSAANGRRTDLSSLPGVVVAEFDALNPGPLGDTQGLPATSFSGGRYKEIALTEDIVLYRVHTNLTGTGQGARELGAFWTPDRPLGSLQSRIDLALHPSWGTVATHYTAIRVPKGTSLYVGEVGNQGGTWVGGRAQVVPKEKVRPQWIIERGNLR